MLAKKHPCSVVPLPTGRGYRQGHIFAWFYYRKALLFFCYWVICTVVWEDGFLRLWRWYRCWLWSWSRLRCRLCWCRCWSRGLKLRSFLSSWCALAFCYASVEACQNYDYNCNDDKNNLLCLAFVICFCHNQLLSLFSILIIGLLPHKVKQKKHPVCYRVF